MKQTMTRAFTLIELLVVIAIIAILAAMLFPVFAGARERANQTSCMSNMKQLGTAMYSYLQDYDEFYPVNRFPPPGTPLGGNLQPAEYNWKHAIYSLVKSREVFRCPSNPERMKFDESGDWPRSYAYNGGYFHENANNRNGRPASINRVKEPSSTLLLVESRGGDPDLGPWMITATYNNNPKMGAFQSHRGRVNFLFADTHAKSMKLAQTCVPNEMWHDARPEYTQAYYNTLAQYVRDEYK